MTQTLIREPLVQVAAQVCAEHGSAACLVGGAVRDLLLGRPLHDWDLVVERDAILLARATANRLGAAFYPLDEARDTGRVVAHTADGARTFLDFALRRGEDWQADLAARDFTVNAMALPLGADAALNTEAVLDPFGGQADLRARRVRSVTDHSLHDDPARIMRALRLAGDLGFEIQAHTVELIQRDAACLAQVSAERVRDELAKLLAQPNAGARLRQMNEWGLVPHVLPETAALAGVEQSRPHHWPALEHTLYALDALERLVAPTKEQADDLPGVPAPEFVWRDVAQVLADFRERLAAHLSAPLGDERPALVALKLAVLLHDCAKPHTRTLDETGRTPRGRATWVEVSILKGWLIAYEGTKPVFATLIAPGRGGVPRRGVDPIDDAATPVGSFRIDGKFWTATMANEAFVHSDVPFAQNFHGPHALHMAYWHDDWGQKKSGGCINLSPEDARWFFLWTEPPIPDGWHGVRSDKFAGPATIVVVHS